MPIDSSATRQRIFSALGLARVANVALLGFTLLLPQAFAQTCAGNETPVALGFTGAEQTATVPAGVTSLTVYLSGAQGGAGLDRNGGTGGAGGLGGRVQGTLAVTPGATLSVWVGGQASLAVNPGGAGGRQLNANATAVGAGGGGATDLRVGGSAIANRVAIAGGGGGGGAAGSKDGVTFIAGGAGGAGGSGTAGAAGMDVTGGAAPGPFGGGGGSSGSGGSGGGGCSGFPSTAGDPTTGAGGGSFNFTSSSVGAGLGGGGGGGAVVGGGGGGAGVGTTGCISNWNGGGGGGAGGTSSAAGLTAVTLSDGVQSGNGAALLCFAAPSNFSVGGSVAGQTGPVTLQLAATNPSSSQQVVVAQTDTAFVFPTSLLQGAGWTISVLSAPAGQLCSVNPASGAAIAANVTNVAVTCAGVNVVVNPGTLPDGLFGAAYSQALSATSADGGIGPYSFSVIAGALPNGLSLSRAGVLSGTPTAVGSFNLTVQATSSNNFSGTRAYLLAISQVDSDGDGVLDSTDQCAATPSGAPANAVGCPTDSDSDGVFDGVDTCAATPRAAFVNSAGCPTDSDGDGVFDGIDGCSATPSGASVNSVGCPTAASTPTPLPSATPVPTSVPTSTPTPTPTPTADADTDSDGVLRSVEADVPNPTGDGRGDGNGDSIADTNQPHVASLETVDLSDYITVVSVGERQLGAVTAVAVPDDFPSDAVAPFGSVSFAILGVVPGAVETVEIHMPFDPDIDGVLKKNRITGEWDNIVIAVDNVGAAKTIVTFELQDGGPYDVDGAANGVIVDPVMPAIMKARAVGRSGGAFGPLLIGVLVGLVALRRRLLLPRLRGARL